MATSKQTLNTLNARHTGTMDANQASSSIINANIAKVKSLSKFRDSLVQDTLVLIHSHISATGDHTGFNRLIEAMGNGSRVNAVKLWVETFTWCVWDNKTKSFIKDHNKTMPSIELAKAALWTEVDGGEKEYVPFNAENALKSLKAKLSKDAEKGVLDEKALATFSVQVKALVEEAIKSSKQSRLAA